MINNYCIHVKFILELGRSLTPKAVQISTSVIYKHQQKLQNIRKNDQKNIEMHLSRIQILFVHREFNKYSVEINY